MDTDDAGSLQPGFDDFVLEVIDERPGRGARRVSKRRDYSVRLRTPAGDLRSTMRLPFDSEELANLLLRIENAILWSGGQSRRVIPSERLRVVQDFGITMFHAALGDAAGGLYHQSRAMAERDGKGLRIKLRIEPPELAALPWEFLFDNQRSCFIGLSTRTPIVRDLGLPFAAEPLAVSGPLRILGMVASPNGLDPIDIPREKARVEAALKEPIDAGAVALRWLPGKTWEDLQSEIQRGKFHVFHFIGHGGFDVAADQGLIALADEDDNPYYLPADDLAMLLDDEDALRLVVLNSCDGARGGTQDIFSSTASILVRRAIPAVLAMQYEITDAAAIAFSRSFYQALADGVPIDAAVANGRQAVRLSSPGSLEWATPVLYQRAPDGVLFDLKTGSRSARSEAPAALDRTSSTVVAPVDSPSGTEPGTIEDVASPVPVKPAPAQEADANIAPPAADDAPADGNGAPPRPPGAIPAGEAAGVSGADGEPEIGHAPVGLRGAVDRLAGSATVRALLLIALGISLLAGLLFDSAPWVIVAACIGMLAAIGLLLARNGIAEGAADAPSGTSPRAIRAAALACVGIGAAAIMLVAAGIPRLTDIVADIDAWSSPRRVGALLAGVGAIALGALVGGVRRPRWTGSRGGAGITSALFLAALIGFLPFGNPSPQPVVAAACDAQRAAPAPTARVDSNQSAMFRGSAARTGRDPMATGTSPEARILASGEDQVWSSAVIAQGRMFVGGNDGLVHGVDVVTGKPLDGWPFDTQGIVYSSPLVAAGVAYVASFTSVDGTVGELHAIDIATGDEREGWPLQVHAGIYASPILVDGELIVGDIEGHLYRVDVARGEARKIDLGSPIWSTAAVADGTAYVGTQDKGVVAVGLVDGTIKWSSRSGPVMSSPAVVNGTVYVGSDDGCVYALSASSGAERWRFQTGDKVFSSPGVSNGVVYIGSKDSNLYALDADSGAEVWRFDTRAMIWSSPAISDGVVYFGCDDGRLYALDASTGVEYWHVPIVRRELDLPDYHRWRQMRASPLVVGDYVVMGSYDGNVYVITVGELAAPLPVASPAPSTPEPGATPVP